LTNESYSKKQIAKELGITIQTVHATLAKVIESCSDKVKLVGKKNKVVEAVIIKEGDEVIGSKDKKIKITWAPNQWGLPITNPPTYIIDPTYNGEDTCVPIEENKTLMDELIQY
jgi:hypothetical protein